MRSAREFNFDGLVGPSHNYAGLSFGNVASFSNVKSASNPRLAALQGLAKMRTLAARGFAQGLQAYWAALSRGREYRTEDSEVCAFCGCAHFFDGVKFFRVVPKFVVQFGISPYPGVSKAWQNATIHDDPVTVHNTRGAVTFASAGPDSRTTQVFINLGDNENLDQSGFAPFGAVSSGMDVVDKLYSGYADAPTDKQGEMAAQGNAYLDKNYPKLDSIKTARVTQESNPALP